MTYNADAEVYGASSYKALYALYICESLVETGQVSLDDSLGTYGGYNMGWQTVRDLIEAAVVNSDNDSFIALRAAFDRVGYEDWIVGLGVDYDTALDPMSDFPTYCPRTSAKLWCEMSEYLSHDTETSQWLSGLLASTADRLFVTALRTTKPWCATRQAGLARMVAIRHAMRALSTSMVVPMS